MIILGSLRGGEATWQSMYDNLLDVNHADSALMVGEQNESDTAESPYQRAKYVWEFPEYADWGDAIDTINVTKWRSTIKDFVMPKSSILEEGSTVIQAAKQSFSWHAIGCGISTCNRFYDSS